MTAALNWTYRHTLRSVPFGVALMALIAGYVAVGSGLPGVRERFELDEIGFFTALPFKVLCGVFVLTIATITVARIPLTPPRYGVWSIHLGIILLVLGLGAYYHRKVEGVAFVPMNGEATQFYDRWERALYARVGPSASLGVPLVGLPRFKVHDGLDDWVGLEPRFSAAFGAGKGLALSDLVASAEPVRLDVVGYHPYAEIDQRWEADQPNGKLGVRLDTPTGPAWTVADDAADAWQLVGGASFAHRHLPDRASADLFAQSADKLHKLTAKVDGADVGIVHLAPGRTTKLGDTGYTLTGEGYVPQWTTIDGASVRALVVRVERPTGEPRAFRRMVLDGRDTQTDFVLGASGAGPMGKRQETPLDDRLALTYEPNDTMNLLPVAGGQARARVVLATNGEDGSIVAVGVSSDLPPTATTLPDGKGQVGVSTGDALARLAGAPGEGVALNVERQAGLVYREALRDVPPEQRDAQLGQAGTKQVVRVRVRSGEHTQDVLVPFVPWAMEARGGDSRPVFLPNAKGPFQLALGNVARPIPVAVRLNKFEAVPYAGGTVVASSVMRDFRSHVTLSTRDGSAPPRDATVQLNQPAFVRAPGPAAWLPGESWLLYQNAWDPEAQRFTILGVANRPAVGTMTLACALIGVGLAWAFYVKPVLIARAKRRALAEWRTELKPEPRGERVSSEQRP